MKKLFSVCLTLLAGTLLFADSSSRLNITEQDGSPSTFPYKLKVTNGSLTDNGDGTASLTTGGGAGGTPAMPFTSVQFNDSGSFGGNANLEWDNTNKQLNVGVVDTDNFFATSLLLGQSTSGSAPLTIGVGNDAYGIRISTTTNKTFAGYNVSNSTIGISWSILKDYGGSVFQQTAIGTLNQNIFPITFRTSNVGQGKSVSLVVQSTGVAISSDTYISGSLNLIGTGDSAGTFTIGNSTYGVLSATTPIAPNHVLIGNSTNYTAIDGGLLLSTQTVTVTISSGTGFNGLSIPVWRTPTNTAVTVVKILAETLAAGTTVLYQLDERAFGSINSAGSSIFSVAFSTANNTGVTTTSFSDSALATQASLILTTPAAGASAGSPTALTFTIYYNRNTQ